MAGGYLSEHQQPTPVEENPENPQPSDEERELCKQIDRLFEKHAKHRKKYDKNWVDNYRLYCGDQWLKKRPSYKNKEVINFIFRSIQTQVPVMFDTRPQVGFLPRDPSDLEFAEILQQVFDADWERNNWLDEITQVVYDGHIYGTGTSYLGYDENAFNGEGAIKFCCDDPFNAYPDPDSTDVNKNSEAFICAKPEDIDKIKKKYAGHKYVKMIKPDLDDLSYLQRKVETLHRRKNTDLDLSIETKSSTSDQDDLKDKVLVITAYLKPSDTEEIEKEDENSNEKIYITRLKYPRGRKVVKINNYIFEDTELPFDHLEIPYQRYTNYVLPREYFGQSDIDNTKGPQMTFNRLVNYALDCVQLMGNPIWLVPVESGINTRKLINQPGLVIEHANADKVGEPKRVDGVGIEPSVLQMIDRMEKWFNDEAMTQDVTRGINPTGVTANAAIENLLDQAQKPIKQKMRNLDSYLKDFGRQWVSLCMQYYTAPRVFRITNKEGANTYFKMHIDNRPVYGADGQPELDAAGKPKTQRVGVVQHYVKDDFAKLVPSPKISEYEIKGDFDVVVSTISGLGFSKAEKQQDLLNLFDRQIIDAEEVLKGMDYPNREKILQRMQEQQAQQAAAQQQPA